MKELLVALDLGNEDATDHGDVVSEKRSSSRDILRIGGVSEKPRLAIVMWQSTQFDGPLFAHLVRNGQLELRVYYTAPDNRTVIDVDPEIGVRPIWGEMDTSGYNYKTRTSGVLGGLRFLRAIFADHPDLIIISGYAPLIHALLALYAWVHRVPVGLRSDTTLQHSKTAKESIRGQVKRFILKNFLKVYSTAHPVGTLSQEYLEYHGVPKGREFPFPYAVNNKWFCNESRAYSARRSELRHEMGVAENAFVVLGILKFHDREDPVTLLLGFAELLKRRHDSCHLLLVGDGPLRGKIETVIRDKGILYVTLPGYVPYRDLPKYYAAADVFVHPGVGEAWGVSVNESMACGVPVVLSDRIGSHVDLVREGETGSVFKAKDPLSLTQCLATMASDRNLCEIMGNKARVLIDDWGYEATERSLLRALQYVLPRMRVLHTNIVRQK